ncbi:MAG: DUF2269 family protein [Jatrophihabitantaceae bacterium]
MYDVALFGHLIGVVVLISAVVMTVSGLVRAQRASTVSQIRIATGAVPLADRLIPPAMLLVLGFGLYMVARHGDDGSIAWDAGWLDVSLAIFAVMAVLGPAVETKRAKALWTAARAATGEAITPQLDRLRRDPILTQVSMFGSCQLVAFLYLMSNKPALLGSLTAIGIAALVSIILTRVGLHTAATRPGATSLAPADLPQPAVPTRGPR